MGSAPLPKTTTLARSGQPNPWQWFTADSTDPVHDYTAMGNPTAMNVVVSQRRRVAFRSPPPTSLVTVFPPNLFFHRGSHSPACSHLNVSERWNSAVLAGLEF